MPQHRKQSCEGYPSPETVNDYSDCDAHDPSSNSSFASQEHTHKAGRQTQGQAGEEARHEDDIDEEVRRAVELVRARENHQPLPVDDHSAQADWIELDITPPQFQSFLDELERHGLFGYFEHKVRHDYDPCRCLLVLRMPTFVHETFTTYLLTKITSWIVRLQAEHLQHPAVEEIVSKVTPGASGQFKIRVPAESGVRTYTHSPDGQFRYMGYKVAPCIIEIAYSQRKKDIAKLAKHYYEGSDGQIKTVLAIDLSYTAKAQRRQERRQRRSCSVPKNKQASFSLYRGDGRVVHEQLFRDQAGMAVQSEGITLFLSDLVPDAVLHGHGAATGEGQGDGHDLGRPELSLHITAHELFDMLVRSETIQQDEDTSPSPPPPAPSQKRKVAWELEESSNDGESEDMVEQDQSPARRSSSKKRRLSSEGRAYSSSAQPSTVSLGVRTRSQSRGGL